jgi:hypothetical protein
MAISQLFVKDRLDGVSNYRPWKERIMLMSMQDEIWEFANTQITPPIDPTQLVIHNQKDVKARHTILNGIKDHFIPNLSKKNTTKDMWEAQDLRVSL